jgi:hypothetical protein
MAYRESTQPGRYLSLNSYLLKATLLLYAFPLVISVTVILLLLFLPQPSPIYSPSPPLCLSTPNPSALYYTLTSVCFLLPDLFTTVFNLTHLLLYLRSKFSVFNRFLSFPILQILGSSYYLTITVWRIVTQENPWEYAEVPVLCVPVLYVMVFWGIVVARAAGSEREESSQSISSARGRDQSLELSDRSWSEKARESNK